MSLTIPYESCNRFNTFVQENQIVVQGINHQLLMLYNLKRQFVMYEHIENKHTNVNDHSNMLMIYL